MSATPPDYYAVLGLAADADGEAIRTAYRALAKQHHPDLAGGEESQSAGRFLEIQEAYDVLGDGDRRAQYDLDRRRQEALEAARRLHRVWADRQPHASLPPGMRVAVQPVAPFSPPRRRSTGSAKFYVGAVVLVVAVLGVILYQEREKNLAAKRDQITVVRVDGGYLGGPPSNADALAKEKEQFARLQASQAEAARIRAEAEKKVASMPSSLPPPAPPSRAPVEPPAEGARRKIDCSGEGRTFYVTREKEIISVSYNGGPLVRPQIHEQGAGLIIMSMVEPTNRISLGFMKGDKDRTIVLISDAVGNVFRTFGVDCSAAAF